MKGETRQMGPTLILRMRHFFTEILIGMTGLPHRYPDALIIILNRGTDYIEYHKGLFNYEKNHRVP